MQYKTLSSQLLAYKPNNNIIENNNNGNKNGNI